MLKEFGSSSLGNPSRAIDDEVLGKTHGVMCAGFDREGDAGISRDVLELAPVPEVSRDDLVLVQSCSDDRRRAGR
jgi:hypothetical protein